MLARASLVLVLALAAPRVAAAQIAPGAPGSDADDGWIPPPETVADADSGSGSGSDTGSGSVADSGSDADSGSAADSDADSDAVSVADSDSDSAADSDSVSVADSVTVSGADGVSVAGPVSQGPMDDAGHRPTWSVLVPGIAIFGASWVANIAASLPAGTCGPSITTTPGGGGCVEDPGWAGFRVAGLVPLIGPWIQLATKPGSLDDDRWALWLGIDGVVQLAGLVVLIAGASIDEEREPPAVAVTPWVGPGSAGIATAGAF